MIHTNLPTVSKPTPVGSIITVKQGPESIEVLTARALKGALGQQQSIDKSDGVDGGAAKAADGAQNVDRWSQSTTTSERTGRREDPPWKKSSNASNPPSPRLSKRSPRSSPSRFRPPSSGSRLDQYRPGATVSSPKLRADNRLRLTLPLADLNNRPRLKSPLSPHIMSAGGMTPGSNEPSDYFGLGIAVSATNQDGSSPMSPVAHSRYAQPRNSRMESPKRIGIEPGRNSTIESSDNSKRRSRANKEKREKDKKTMLSKALEKANTAVLLDNASNFVGALEAYKDACALLQHVCERTNSAEDKLKLENIRVTYTTRIEELLELEQLPMTEGAEKELPPRPTSNDSEDFAPQLAALRPMSPFQSPSAGVQELEGDSVAELPATSMTPTRQRTRDSFLTDAIRQVEGSSPAGGFLGPLWEQSKSPLGIGLSRSREELTSPDAPLPLRSASPQPPPKDKLPSTLSQPLAELEGDAQQKGAGFEQGSWLNTLEESDDGSETSSVHSASNGEIRRRDLRSGQHEPTSEFDAAFDAAVEAAYEDGYVPDEDPSPASTRKVPDSLEHGFDFNLPERNSTNRESDSTGVLTQHTRQSSTMTEPTNDTSFTANEPLIEEDEAQYTLPATAFERSDNTVLDRRNRAPGPQLKPLKIDTFAAPPVRRKLSSASRMTTDSTRMAEPGSGEAPDRADVAPWEITDNKRAPSISKRTVEPMSARGEACPWEVDTGSPEEIRVNRVGSLRRPDRDGVVPGSASTSTTDLNSPMSKLRVQKSFASLRDAVSGPAPVEEQTPETPHSATFYSRRNDSTSHLSQRSIPHTLGSIPPLPDFTTQGGGYHLFDTSLGRSNDQSANSSPRTSKEYAVPLPFEPCPDSHLLRPFWLLRTVSNAATHPRGGYITNKLFMPHEAWLNRTLKIRNVEDKIAACDLLTAAAERFSNVDTYDADAVLEEMQHFEDVMEKVQATLVKKLGGEVGVTGVGSMFKEADKGESPTENGGKEAGSKGAFKSSLSSWRKLRGKNSAAAPTSISSGATNKPGERISDTMASVPMTSFAGVEKRTGHRRDALRDAIFEGPHKDYMASVARLAEAAQVIGEYSIYQRSKFNRANILPDQIARQVEDPGLRHSSPTHVGLELSTRHAAEFFGFYVCRFVLSDVGMFIDKYVKRSTEWILA